MVRSAGLPDCMLLSGTNYAHPTSGRTYWYNKLDKSSVWEKPDALKTPFERAMMETSWKEYTNQGRKYWVHKVRCPRFGLEVVFVSRRSDSSSIASCVFLQETKESSVRPSSFCLLSRLTTNTILCSQWSMPTELIELEAKVAKENPAPKTQ
jgi:hypothetical protein